MEDNRMIKRCQLGEKNAFQELISKYHPYVYKFLVRMTGEYYLSEDLTQETFIKLIRNIDKFDVNGKAEFSTYLITICKNCYIDYYRKSKKLIDDISIDENLSLQYENVEEMIINEIDQKNVIREIDKLPENQKMVLKMKYIEGLTLKEIGETLHLEPKTIKSRIHNGIIKLRKVLEGGE